MFKIFSLAYWGQRKRERATEDYKVKREVKALKMEKAQILKEANKKLNEQMHINKKEIRINRMKK